jgi:hypothetical protein
MQTQFPFSFSIEVIKQNLPEAIGILMFVVLGVSIMIFISVSFAFVFHWRKYGNGGKTLKNAEWIFIFGSLAILFLMVLSFLSFWF